MTTFYVFIFIDNIGGGNGGSLRPEASISLSIPLRRSAESICNLSSAKSNRRSMSLYRRSHGERSLSFSFDNATATTNRQHQHQQHSDNLLLSQQKLQSKLHSPTSSLITSSIQQQKEIASYQQQYSPSSDAVAANIAVAMTIKDRKPIVYPALLSKVSDAFRERVIVNTKTKDNIQYSNAFDGREAVVCFVMLVCYMGNDRERNSGRTSFCGVYIYIVSLSLTYL